jgi:hypothetical protein
MLGRTEQIFNHEVLTPASTGLGTTILSKVISYGQEPLWLLVIKYDNAITGTTPGIVWEADVSDNGGAFTRVGGAVATQVTTVPIVIPYATGTTQGAMAANTAGHTYTMQIKGVFGNADNVANGVTVDLIAVQ